MWALIVVLRTARDVPAILNAKPTMVTVSAEENVATAVIVDWGLNSKPFSPRPMHRRPILLACDALQAVLRCDTILLLAPVGLYLILDRQISIVGGIVTGLASALAAASASFAVDSVFWRQPVWPELSVLLFNTIDNRRAAQGSMRRMGCGTV